VTYSQFDHITDAGLLDNFYRDKHNKWLGVLMQRYTLLLYGVCMKYLKDEEEAKDAVQQIFLKAIAELHKYPVTYFKSWIYMIARNYCLMQLRDKSKTPVPVTEKMLVDTPGEEDILMAQHRKDVTLEIMHEALNELNDEQKKCVEMFYLQKKSYSDIASLTRYTLLQVKSYIQNGKRNLKNLVEKKLNAVSK